MPLSTVSPVPVLLAIQKLVPSLVTTSRGLNGTDGPVAVLPALTVMVPGSATLMVKVLPLAVATVKVPLREARVEPTLVIVTGSPGTRLLGSAVVNVAVPLAQTAL